jgi:alpha/beta superfamily hydrolase
VRAEFVARREEDGYTIEAGFFGPAGARLFGVLCLPHQEALAGVVVCPGLHTDFTRDYRNEVLLGWALARRGLAVLRFHHTGQGHSDGDADQMSFESLKEDALAATSLVRSIIGGRELAFVGCRLGGLIASAAARGHDGAPLVLWHPVPSVDEYLREVLRTRRMSELAGGAGADQSDPFDAASDGFVNAFGTPVYATLVQSFRGRTLTGELGQERRSIFTLVSGAGKRPRREEQHAVEALGRAGFDPDVHSIGEAVAWWVSGARHERDGAQRVAAVAVPATVDWLAHELVALEAVR